MPKTKILVVDDVAENRLLVSTLLGYAGHEALEAADGWQALALVRKHQPALIICDILMPTMDGYAFVRELRKDALVGNTEVIFFTATFLEQEALALARSCGVTRVLTKPCEPQVILDAIASALAGSAGTSAPALQPPQNEFDLMHLRVVTDKLIEKVDALERANKRLAALADLNTNLASEREPQAMLERFCRGVRGLFGAKLAIVSAQQLPEQPTATLCIEGDDAVDRDLAAMHAAAVVRSLRDADVHAPVQVQRASSGGDAMATSLHALVPDARCFLLAPLVSPTRIYGWVILVDKLGADRFNAQDEDALAVQAAQTARVYEGNLLFARIQLQFQQLQQHSVERERAERLLRLEHAVSRALADAEVMESGLQSVLQIVCEANQWALGRCWLASQGVLRIAAQWAQAQEISAAFDAGSRGLSLQSGEGLAGRVWATGLPIWAEHLATDPRLVQTAILQDTGMSTALLFPVSNEGRTVGVLSFLAREAREPDARLQASALVIGHQLGQFIQRKQTEHALRDSERFAHSTLDSLLEHICVLDSAGVIMATNHAWRAFSQANGALLASTGVGANYLEVCEQAVGIGRSDALALGAGVQDVLTGAREMFSMEYACDGPVAARWFVARVSRFAGDGPVRVVIAHENTTERKLVEQRVRRLHRISSVLSEINSLIVRVRHRDELFRDACRIAIETGHFNMAWIGTIAEDGATTTVLAAHGAKTHPPAYFDLVRESMQEHVRGRGLVYDQVFIAQQPIVENDIAQSTWMALREPALQAGSRSLAVLPLLVGQRTVGVFVLHAPERDFFDDEEYRLLQDLSGDISLALAHMAQAEQIDRLAYFDTLTGLANRTLFNDRVAQTLVAAQRQSVGLMLLDIERFKLINDSLGRHAGDDLLRQFSRRVCEAAGDVLRVGRVGSDQFGVLLLNAHGSVEIARAVSEVLARSLEQAFEVGGRTLMVAARVGVALYPEDGEHAETLFRNAEAALKRAKASGEKALFYDARMTEAIAEKLALETQLRMALQNDRFVLHYQPKVDCASRRVEGVEALIRWQDPELGLVPPSQFIPLMEETGLIVEVGAWALRKAVSDHRRWLQMGLDAPRIAVNVSAIQLQRSDFVERVLPVLAEGGRQHGIDIEITESAIVRNIAETVEKLQLLRRSGVTLAIDDFGTGYSSLAYLAQLPVQILKIDRAFVSTMVEDRDARTLVSTMISLAHALRMKVVAEGVETSAQAELLLTLQCDYLQGFLISKPLPEEALLAWLQSAV